MVSHLEELPTQWRIKVGADAHGSGDSVFVKYRRSHLITRYRRIKGYRFLTIEK